MSHMERERIVDGAVEARLRAEATLRSLLRAKADAERRLAEARSSDPYAQVTGRSSLDNSIASTRRCIETLNEAISRAVGSQIESRPMLEPVLVGASDAS